MNAHITERLTKNHARVCPVCKIPFDKFDVVIRCLRTDEIIHKQCLLALDNTCCFCREEIETVEHHYKPPNAQMLPQSIEAQIRRPKSVTALLILIIIIGVISGLIFLLVK